LPAPRDRAAASIVESLWTTRHGRGKTDVVEIMPPASSARRDACPHCGQPAGVKWRHLLPSGARNRAFKCQACGGLYDLSDNCRMASVIGGLLGMGPAILVFGRIVKAGGNSRLSVLLGTVFVAMSFFVVSIIFARLALRLQPKR
jgi:hypothetical protein